MKLKKHGTEIRTEMFQMWETGNYTKTAISKKLNLSVSFVSSTILRAGYISPPKGEDLRKHPVLHSYFESIDTEDKAYFLGFLYADGYNNESKGIIQINLQARDRDVLDKLSFIVQPTKNLYYIPKKEQYSMVICSKKMSQDLAKWGCVQRKTFGLQFPTFLKEDLIRHFIRGYFDGDGCVMVKRETRDHSFRVCGTQHMVLSIQQHLINNCSMGQTKVYEKQTPNTENILYTIGYGGRKKLLTIRAYLYKDSTTYLQRKYDKFYSIHFYPKENPQDYP